MTTVDTTVIQFSGTQLGHPAVKSVEPAVATSVEPAVATSVEPAEANSSEEYSDEAWRQVAAAVREADAEVMRTRELVREATAEYGRALVLHEQAQRDRDSMILKDPRKSAAVSRLAGVSRPRVSQIRAAHGMRGDGVEIGSDSHRLLALTRDAS